jgi:predicted RNase H-like nuclease (RuvC/YqgF family)
VGLTVKRSINLIVIVTERFREEVRAELQEAVDTTQRRMEQMDFQGRRLLAELQRTDITQAMGARRQLEAEKRRYESLRQELLDQLAEIEKLELGSEYQRGTLEGQVEVEVGDNLFTKMAGASIIIKDGVVIEVREEPVSGMRLPAGAPEDEEPEVA